MNCCIAVLMCWVGRDSAMSNEWQTSETERPHSCHLHTRQRRRQKSTHCKGRMYAVYHCKVQSIVRQQMSVYLSCTIVPNKLVHWPLTGWLLHLLQEWGDWVRCHTPATYNSPSFKGQCYSNYTTVTNLFCPLSSLNKHPLLSITSQCLSHNLGFHEI